MQTTHTCMHLYLYYNFPTRGISSVVDALMSCTVRSTRMSHMHFMHACMQFSMVTHTWQDNNWCIMQCACAGTCVWLVTMVHAKLLCSASVCSTELILFWFLFRSAMSRFGCSPSRWALLWSRKEGRTIWSSGSRPPHSLLPSMTRSRACLTQSCSLGEPPIRSAARGGTTADTVNAKH